MVFGYVVPQNQQGMVYDRMRGGWVTPNVQSGINNQTGGINTFNRQVMDSAFHHARESSKYNGTHRWERRPIYGAAGRAVLIFSEFAAAR